MSDTVRRNREVSPAEYEELQKLVFDLVRERVLAAIGANGMWSINFRSAADTDAFFSHTVAERIAKDVTAHIIPQAVAANEPVVTSTEIERHTAEIEVPEMVEVLTETAAERVVWVAEPSQVAWVAEFAEARASDRADLEAAAAAEADTAKHEREHRQLVA